MEVDTQLLGISLTGEPNSRDCCLNTPFCAVKWAPKMSTKVVVLDPGADGAHQQSRGKSIHASFRACREERVEVEGIKVTRLKSQPIGREGRAGKRPITR